MQVATGYVFHSGELALQKRDGTAETASRFNSYIKTEIDVVLGRNDFLHELRTVYLSTSDENGDPLTRRRTSVFELYTFPECRWRLVTFSTLES
mmetsp:Transcript_9099/g.40006  ORF Transcript_9099/g.40006 Transcript_9099/m.40006 type:complete len:94 (+) Transcript_9099:58-339(+)